MTAISMLQNRGEMLRARISRKIRLVGERSYTPNNDCKCMIVECAVCPMHAFVGVLLTTSLRRRDGLTLEILTRAGS